MRWQNREESDHVEDRRGQGGMPLRGLPIGGKGGGALLLIAVLVAGYFGFDLTPLLGMFGGGSEITMSQSGAEADSRDEQLAKFTSVALRSTEDAWGGIFQRAGQRYDPPTLVLYSGTTDTACGYGESAMGPFYCPADQKVYIDLAFYRDMENKLGGGGDFALGYVLAHEVGHHVQNEMGISREVRQRMAQSSKTDANKLSVMQELQADCFAGVWGNMARRQGMLESGDLEEALNTATAIGDDRLQRQSMGRVVPDSFTHGTSRQRVYWFRRGFDSGDPGQCNTFAGVN